MVFDPLIQPGVGTHQSPCSTFLVHQKTGARALGVTSPSVLNHKPVFHALIHLSLDFNGVFLVAVIGLTLECLPFSLLLQFQIQHH